MSDTLILTSEQADRARAMPVGEYTLYQAIESVAIAQAVTVNPVHADRLDALLDWMRAQIPEKEQGCHDTN